MNVRPGDLAVLVASLNYQENIGSIVKVLGPGPDWYGFATWFITPAKMGTVWARDSALRPIRDQPGADETLTWAPVPQKEPA